MGGISLLCCLLSIISVICVLYFACKLEKHTPPYKYVSQSGIFAVLTSVSTFMLFKNLKIPNSRIINTIVAATFGVLLIHDNSYDMRQWLWHFVVDVKLFYSVGGYATYLYLMIIILAIFFICVGIDILRKKTIEKYSFEIINRFLR